MTLTGGCHCGALRYRVNGNPTTAALCHCIDCRRIAGAPMVAWMMVREEQLTVTAGTPREYASSTDARRFFCSTCGTQLFYRNAVNLPGIVDIQSATLDHPDSVPMQAHIQVADRIGWMETVYDLPMFDRYPPQA